VNQYVLLRRLRGPIILLIFGVTAILDEYTRIHYSESWPLYIIAWGILKLAENAILARNPPAPPAPYPGYPPPPGGYPYPGNYAASAAANTPGGGQPSTTSTAIVPANHEEGR